MKSLKIELPDKEYPQIVVKYNSFYDEVDPSKLRKKRGGIYQGLGALLASERAKEEERASVGGNALRAMERTQEEEKEQQIRVAEQALKDTYLE